MEEIQNVVFRPKKLWREDICLHYMEAGPEEGQLVILLHGFPEFWYGWRKQIFPLINAGYHIIIPDQRGFGRSDKPSDIDKYRLDVLRDDVIAIIDNVSIEKAIVIGHDWGAAVGWWFALTKGDRILKLVIMNVPHPRAFLQTLSRDLIQGFRSWYFLCFQIPVLPELLLRLNNFSLLKMGLRTVSKSEAFTKADFKKYCEMWRQPGTLRGMINWYRANFRLPKLNDWTVRVPTLILWGLKDPFLRRSLIDQSASYCDRVEVVKFPNNGHFLQLENPEMLNYELLNFLSSAKSYSI